MELNIEMRPLKEAEEKYTFFQSQQLYIQSGCIGYLSAEMSQNGNELFSSWDDLCGHWKTDAFKTEFDNVINTLRYDEKGEGFLKNRSSLAAKCSQTPESAFKTEKDCYGFRIDTEKYAYLLRLNPNKGETNLYCYCYVRDLLDRHMRKAEKGIRFITPDYKELFRIKDGDRIRVITDTGEKLDRESRYIDDYHLEVGNNLYHICEFAERMHQAGNTVIPLRNSLPDRCYAVLPSTGELILITKGEKGYTSVNDNRNSREQNQKLADGHNSEMGISKAQAEAMLSGSMFGWHTKAADPANYDANGTPIRQRVRERGEAR